MEFDLNGNARSFTFDPQGSCVATSNGVTQNPEFYDGYGEPVWPYQNDTRNYQQPFQYKGQAGYYTDYQTGLCYCIHRYYDPMTGRWLERDPSGLEGGVNVYEYCGDNPVMCVDPSGLYQIVIAWHTVLTDLAHAFILVRDDVPISPTYNKVWCYDAGPEREGAASFTNPGAIIDHSGPYGQLLYGRLQYDYRYNPFCDDKGTVNSSFRVKVGKGYEAAGGFTLIKNNLPVGPVLKDIDEVRSYMGTLPIQYDLWARHPGSGNSNSFVSKILKAMGFRSLGRVLEDRKTFHPSQHLPGFTGSDNDPWEYILTGH